MSSVDDPFCIQIELTEGCNLFCNFCGLNGIRKGPMKDLKFADVASISRLANKIKQAKWKSRIEFAMHGEPTLHPEWLRIIRLFREALPKHNMTLVTNGYGFCYDEHRKARDTLSTASAVQNALYFVNCIALDSYEYAGLYKRIQKAMDHASIAYSKYPQQPSANPHRRRAANEPHEFVFVQDISEATKGNHSVLNNHCGSGSPLDESAHGRCAKPFRELSVRYNGNVAVCCNDWRGEYIVGNVHDFASLKAFWNHPNWDPARRFLYDGQRTMKPCFGCNAKSYRVGLLPDQKGRKTYPAPDEQSIDEWKRIVARPDAATKIPRPWETS